jgi:FMN reductase
MNVVVVAGNPKPASRTAAAGMLLAETLFPSSAPELLDVITLGPGLLGWGDPAVAEAVKKTASADAVVVASPTFKASYTGLLKLFLDQFDTATGLAGVVAVPLMLGAGPAHFMAPDLLLRPVLSELGAICPAQGLYLIDKAYAEGPALGDWVSRWGPAVRASLTVKDGASS